MKDNSTILFLLERLRESSLSVEDKKNLLAFFSIIPEDKLNEINEVVLAGDYDLFFKEFLAILEEKDDFLNNKDSNKLKKILEHEVNLFYLTKIKKIKI